MGMKILLRTMESNPFSKYLIQLCEVKGDVLILAYGFMYSNLIIKTTLIESIDNGFSKYDKDSPKKLILLGGYFEKCECKSGSTCTYCQFKQFSGYCLEFFNGKLKNKPISKEVEVHILLHSSLPNLSKLSKWHGKIAMKIDTDFEEESVLATMIGSSNLSVPALDYNDNSSSECDIYTWNGNKLKNLNPPKKKESIENWESPFKLLEDLDVTPDGGIAKYHKTLYHYMRGVLHPLEF